MVIVVLILLLLCIGVFVFMQTAQFGKLPSGKRLERIEKAADYKNNQFQNRQVTPSLTEGYTFLGVLFEFLFRRKKGIYPKSIIPSVKNNLADLPIDKDVLVWFGHSSYFLQVSGRRILVDPHFSGNASPIPNGTRAFKGSNVYTSDEMPVIDYLLITHDHWDHLDYKTIKELQPKIKRVITSLGTGSHLELWGYDKNIITECNWDDTVQLEDGFTVHALTARHFSGRGFKRNKALWTSFVLEANGTRVFIGGDSGYGDHFAAIGKMFTEFDLVILENGQYDKKWKYIHMMPHEVLQAAKDLNAKMILPVHNSKFALANHAWDDPLIQIVEINKRMNLPLITPCIGQLVYINNGNQKFTEWWTGLD